VNLTEYRPEVLAAADLNFVRPVLVTVCGVGPSFQTHVTVAPFLIVTFAGLNAMFLSVTVRLTGLAAAEDMATGATAPTAAAAVTASVAFW
jgi:hypothetical protein